MYDINDTIVAVSSPTSDRAVIIRITGPQTVELCREFFKSTTEIHQAGIYTGKVFVDAELDIAADLYLFTAGHSYTGQSLSEIHLYTNSSVTGKIIENFIGFGLRTAGPGEFTARAYLNGKIDLTQAEAVNEIIGSSNRYQLAAAEKLLAGSLKKETVKICSEIMNCLSLIEAGLDFSGQDGEFISNEQTIRKIGKISSALEQLLAGSINYESIIDLPAAGIAGVPNSGKSTLLNKLLDEKRSIVSEKRKTTRDVLTGIIELEHYKCVLFDCAGLVINADTLLDRLAQKAAVEALQKAEVVIFCVDAAKPSWDEDVAIRKLINPACCIALATKSDLVAEDLLSQRLVELSELFDSSFSVVSAKTGKGMKILLEKIDEKITGSTERFARSPETHPNPIDAPGKSVAVTARHRQAVTEALENTNQAVIQLKEENNEIAALMLRSAFGLLSNIRQHNIDETILKNIFSHFCIGK